MKFEIKGFVFNGGVYNFLNNEFNYVILVYWCQNYYEVIKLRE